MYYINSTLNYNVFLILSIRDFRRLDEHFLRQTSFPFHLGIKCDVVRRFVVNQVTKRPGRLRALVTGDDGAQ